MTYIDQKFTNGGREKKKEHYTVPLENFMKISNIFEAHENSFKGIIGHADHESGLSILITIISNPVSLMLPKKSNGNDNYLT